MSTIFLCFFSLLIWSFCMRNPCLDTASWYEVLVTAGVVKGQWISSVFSYWKWNWLPLATKKKKKEEKRLCLQEADKRCVFLLVWKWAVEGCTRSTCSQQSLRAHKSICMSFLMTFLSLSDHRLGFEEWEVCLTLIRQEARGWRWARGGNSREGWKPKLPAPKRAMKTCFS